MIAQLRKTILILLPLAFISCPDYLSRDSRQTSQAKEPHCQGMEYHRERLKQMVGPHYRL